VILIGDGAVMKKFVLFACVCGLSACGGGGGSVDLDFKTMTIFSDGAGIAKGTAANGGKLYYMAPNIVADVAASNAAGPVESVNILDYPIVDRAAGYNIRQGADDQLGMNVLVAEKIGTGEGSVVYLYDNFQDALAVAAAPLNGVPSGTHTYTGLYVVGQRGTGWAEMGDFTLAANLDNQTFSISGSSADTSLTGSGYLETSTGSVSSSSLVFADVDFGSYTATTIGTLGGDNAADVVGLWYTNDADADPDFAGGYSGSR